jgi:hypothetical protein
LGPPLSQILGLNQDFSFHWQKVFSYSNFGLDERFLGFLEILFLNFCDSYSQYVRLKFLPGLLLSMKKQEQYRHKISCKPFRDNNNIHATSIQIFYDVRKWRHANHVQTVTGYSSWDVLV